MAVVARNEPVAVWRDVALALVMALGLSSVFLTPLRTNVPTTTPTGPGRVLGASVTVPLVVEVTLKLDGWTDRSSVEPRDGTLIEVLADVARRRQSTLEYRSRGQSIYLTRFLGRADDTNGVWEVSVNGLSVVDLAQPTLIQGDEVTIEYRRP